MCLDCTVEFGAVFTSLPYLGCEATHAPIFNSSKPYLFLYHEANIRAPLGDEKTIIVQDSKVTLGPYRCWVDVWAFEHLLEQAKKADRTRERLRKKYVTQVELLCRAWSRDSKVQEECLVVLWGNLSRHELQVDWMCYPVVSFNTFISNSIVSKVKSCS